MRKLCFTILFSFFVTCLYSQYNLVPNYSFEDSVQCPMFLNNPLPKPWYIPSNISNSYFVHACSLDSITSVPNSYFCGKKNYQPARTGGGYPAITSYSIAGPSNRTYIQVKLKDSLRRGHCYACVFYANLSNSSLKASNNIAMLLTKTKLYSDTIANPIGTALIPASPQVFNYGNPVITDTMNWVKVSSIYTATGEESFITIGNFKNDAQTTSTTINTSGCGDIYYFIEDVSVIPLDSVFLKADAGSDKTIALGNSVYIGSYTNNLSNANWYNAAGSIIATGVPGLNVSPTASTFYMLEQTVCGQYSKDTVFVTVGAVPLVIKNYELRIKNGWVENNWETLNEINVSHFNIQRSEDGSSFKTLQTIAAKNNAYNQYSVLANSPLGDRGYYRVEAVDKDGKLTFSKVLSITLNLKPHTLNLYPNPAKDVITISYSNISQVSIIDMVGRAVYAKNFNNANVVQMNISDLPKGIYLVKVKGGENVIATQKLIIE